MSEDHSIDISKTDTSREKLGDILVPVTLSIVVIVFLVVYLLLASASKKDAVRFTEDCKRQGGVVSENGKLCVGGDQTIIARRPG